ncbi:WD40/YVTN/BNR-like repeat-containing protein [Micromonospora sp. NPDC048063]|uniref:WD40/YVTN/BNR-like repeat-containing protein n=1 Tax=Micromonospora sp. NPDC048063 TaxID=3364256 RepID=UPI003721E98E
MSTSRLRRALGALLALGLTGGTVLAASTAAADTAASDSQWTDSSGLTADAYGHHPDGATVTPTAGETASAVTSTAAAWSLLGPPGGDIYDTAVSPADPKMVLAGYAPGGGYNGGLYRSGDGGATWSEVPALRGRSVFAIEFTAGGTAYVGTQDGVWRSNDGGLTWVAGNLNIGLNDQVLSVAVDPVNPSVLWAGIANALGSQKVNLMRSADGGVTWTNRTPAMGAALSGRAIAIDPNDPNTVIVAFDAGQVWVTRDSGVTWTKRSAGLPTSPLFDIGYDGTRLLVGGGQLFSNQYLGLYQSTDLGVTWTPLHNSSWPTPVVHGIAVDPHDRDTILVTTAGTGVHRTTDGGATWEISVGGTNTLTGRSIRFAPGNSRQVILGTDAVAVFRSTDGGTSFAQSSNGIAEIDLRSIHVNPRDPDEIAIAFQGQNTGGVYSTVDGGANWKREPLPPTRYGTVRFAPDGTLHALSNGPSTVAQEGLYRRGGDGNWTVLGPDQGAYYESDLTTIRFSRTNPDLILLTGADFGYAGTEATIWRTLDRGQTWTKVHEGTSGQAALDVEIVENGTDQEMIASINDRSGAYASSVLRSEDGGTSWFTSMIGLSGRYMNPYLCASSHDPRVVYLAAWLASSSTGVYRSLDGGVTWESTGWTSNATVADLACDPADGRTLYMSLNTDPRVVRSADAGTTFSPFDSGIESVRQPRTLTFAGPSRLLLATAKGSYATNLDRDIITVGTSVRRDRGQLAVDLTWQGATSVDVDIYRDDTLVGTVPNDGAHTDPLDVQGRGTATYQVCRADSSTCSARTTVTYGGPPV